MKSELELDGEATRAESVTEFTRRVKLVLETGVVVCGLVINHNLAARVAGKILNFPHRLGAGDVHDYGG